MVVVLTLSGDLHNSIKIVTKLNIKLNLIVTIPAIINSAGTEAPLRPIIGTNMYSAANTK